MSDLLPHFVMAILVGVWFFILWHVEKSQAALREDILHLKSLIMRNEVAKYVRVKVDAQRQELAKLHRAIVADGGDKEATQAAMHATLVSISRLLDPALVPTSTEVTDDTSE